ncbi:MAG TPA: pyridoxamine 5'-phosphate oxidase [Planctomycetota bacterium]|nr:pyridoxamine 5'-phosphate oxidase [Planctomycetota bacterium]
MGDDAFTGMRIEYGDEPLQRAGMPADPLVLLREWLAAAHAARVSEPNGMALATCGTDGQPHCRIVLLKELDDRGLTFFTNKDSDKGRQLRSNARAAATFWWPAPRNRQVRVEGSIEDATEAVSDRYFGERPRRAQLCSASSPQSRVVTGRAELEQLVEALARQVGDGPVPRPPHWGGYVLVPSAIEYWQGREARLHDRFRYVKQAGSWRLERLAP